MMVVQLDYKNTQQSMSGTAGDGPGRGWGQGAWSSRLVLLPVIRHNTAEVQPLGDIALGKDAAGLSYAAWEVEVAGLPVRLSVSGALGRPVCAAFGILVGPAIPLGILAADARTLLFQPAHFLEDYFSETEVVLANRDLTGASTRDVLVTASWCDGPAPIKMLDLGLQVEANQVTCLVDPVGEPGHPDVPAVARWEVRRFDRSDDGQAHLGEENPVGSSDLLAWWRIQDGYVVNLATV